jgi:hypothetical protein
LRDAAQRWTAVCESASTTTRDAFLPPGSLRSLPRPRCDLLAVRALPGTRVALRPASMLTLRDTGLSSSPPTYTCPAIYGASAAASELLATPISNNTRMMDVICNPKNDVPSMDASLHSQLDSNGDGDIDHHQSTASDTSGAGANLTDDTAMSLYDIPRHGTPRHRVVGRLWLRSRRSSIPSRRRTPALPRTRIPRFSNI